MSGQGFCKPNEIAFIPRVISGGSPSRNVFGGVSTAISPLRPCDQTTNIDGQVILGATGNTPQDDVDAIHEIRSHFPALSQKVYSKPLVYFDNAATSLKPVNVIETLSTFYKTYNSNVHRAAHKLAAKSTEKYEQARGLVASFINAESQQNIVFVRSATEAINLVAYTWGEENIEAGDELLISVAEHHSNMVPWQELATRKRATIKYIQLSTDTGQLDYDNLCIGPKTKLLAIQHVSNVLANVNDLLKLRRALCERGARNAKFLVDACQSLPHLKVDVQSLVCDFLVGSSHKMLGPTGVGFLYGRPNVLESLPPWQFGGEMIEVVE